jgi:hypothetical protein
MRDSVHCGCRASGYGSGRTWRDHRLVAKIISWAVAAATSIVLLVLLVFPLAMSLI